MRLNSVISSVLADRRADACEGWHDAKISELGAVNGKESHEG
jgi:hypothetical protein